MIIILPTSTGFAVGITKEQRELKGRARKNAPQAAPARPSLLAQLAKVKRWMRLSKRYSN